MGQAVTVDVPADLWAALGEALDAFDATEDHPDPRVRAALLVDALKVVRAARACLQVHDQVMCGEVSDAEIAEVVDYETSGQGARDAAEAIAVRKGRVG